MSNDIGLVIGQYLIESFHIHMATDMIGEFVVLFFLESLIVKCIRNTQLVGERLQQEIHKSLIVEDAVNVCTHAFVVNDISVLSSVAEMQ